MSALPRKLRRRTKKVVVQKQIPLQGLSRWTIETKSKENLRLRAESRDLATSWASEEGTFACGAGATDNPEHYFKAKVGIEQRRVSSILA